MILLLSAQTLSAVRVFETTDIERFSSRKEWDLERERESRERKSESKKTTEEKKLQNAF